MIVTGMEVAEIDGAPRMVRIIEGSVFFNFSSWCFE
jgi:ribulose 1,5-bisphosphate synthetase/thiazole synthase